MIEADDDEEPADDVAGVDIAAFVLGREGCAIGRSRPLGREDGIEGNLFDAFCIKLTCGARTWTPHGETVELST